MCMYCGKPKTGEEHFECSICGEGMCDDCYGAEIEHDEHYFEPLENCDDEREVEAVLKATNGIEPAYLCTNCLIKLNS